MNKGNVGQSLLEALEWKYLGDMAVGKANIEVYMNNAAGIGEHPDIIDAIDSQVGKVAEASEKLDVVRDLMLEEEDE